MKRETAELVAVGFGEGTWEREGSRVTSLISGPGRILDRCDAI